MQYLYNANTVSLLVMAVIFLVLVYFWVFDKDSNFVESVWEPAEEPAGEDTMFRGIDMAEMPAGTENKQIEWIYEQRKKHVQALQESSKTIFKRTVASRKPPSRRQARQFLDDYKVYLQRKEKLVEQDVSPDDVEAALEVPAQ